jgi:hypothetical protein
MALLLPMLAVPPPAHAQSHPPMSFTLGRLEGTKPCGGACADFIVATGEVGHAASLRYLLARKFAGDRDIPVLLASPGGYAFGALALGRVWRRLEVTVIVAAAQPTCGPGGSGQRACDPADRAHGVQTFRLTGQRAECASACPVMLAGATRRIAGPRSRIGVHRSAFDEDSALGRAVAASGTTQEAMAKDAARDLETFFAEMGVDPELARRSLRTSHDDMDWLSQAEADAYKVFNTRSEDAALSPALRAALQTAPRR